MKRIFILGLIAICHLPSAICQVKITKATKQKTFGGIGGIFMNYTIGFKNKTTDSIVIDSIITIDEPSSQHFYYNKIQKEYCELAFSFALSAPAKCKTCPDVTPKQSNLTKGIMVYYRRGEKKSRFKVKKFKQLPDMMLP